MKRRDTMKKELFQKTKQVNKLWAMILILASALGSTACSESEKLGESVVQISTQIDSTIEDIQVVSGTYTFENVSTGERTDIAYPALGLHLTDGLYHVTLIGKGTYLHEGKQVEVDIQGTQQNVTVSGGNCQIVLKAYIRQMGEPNFVIAEIFLPGTLNTNNKQYNGDQYIRIHNNSNRVLYADGLILLESAFSTTFKYQSITPNIMDQCMTVDCVVAVPGSGTEYPIQPGESFVICDNAINHKAENPNSIDLSTAKFEWYIDHKMDIDNPKVTNMEFYHCYSKSIWLMNKQGNRAYALGRLPQGMNKEKYIAEYLYQYTYVLPNGSTSRPTQAYKFPNEWIIDAVNVGAKNKWQWNVTAHSLDMGHTYLSPNATIKESIGKCILRKHAYLEGERIVLQDTNNSTVDFIPGATPTLMK